MIGSNLEMKKVAKFFHHLIKIVKINNFTSQVMQGQQGPTGVILEKVPKFRVRYTLKNNQNNHTFLEYWILPTLCCEACLFKQMIILIQESILDEMLKSKFLRIFHLLDHIQYLLLFLHP